MATLSKAIVASLQHFETTANRTLYVHDAVITQNQLIDIEEKLSEGKSFHRNHVDTEALEAQAWQSFKDPASDPLTWIFPFINVSIWSKEQLCAFFRTDNELLDIPEPHGVEFQYVLAEEIFKAKQTLGTAVADAATSASSSTKEAAQKALEDGKRRLVGFRRPRRESQIERVVG